MIKFIVILILSPLIFVAACFWIPLAFLLRPIVRRIPKRCSVHQSKYVWGHPYGEVAFLTGDQLEYEYIRRAFKDDFKKERKKNFPNIESNRDHYSLKNLFSLFPGKHDPWPYCPECLKAEHQWLNEKRKNEEIREITKVNDSGWVICPWCAVKFKHKSTNYVNNRHSSCGHKIPKIRD